MVKICTRDARINTPYPFVSAVDRILRQQKADKEARTQDEDVLLLSTPLRGKLVTPHPTRSTSPSTTAAEIPSSVREKDATTPQPRPTSTLQNWKRKFGSALYSSEAENGGLPAALANSLTIPSHPVPNLLHSVSSCVTPLSNICR